MSSNPPASPRAGVVWLGPDEPALRLLLTDVLGEVGLDLELGGRSRGTVVLALVYVESMAACEALEADLLGIDVPVLALLPVMEDRLCRRACERGAAACYALGTPLDNLRSIVRSLRAA
ncbi:MAG: DNA-binding response regulator [Deltaproteobacteria bacterium]|nr:DNA-binding response regulator [Deltaproteobacteria bacterium]